jgi:translation initiation factor 3 subunit F
LLGTRIENEIEVRSSFAVLHSETSEQVAVDMEYHRSMFDLHQRVHPREVIVGWYVLRFYFWVRNCLAKDLLLAERRYSTGSNLNTYSSLIQNFYSQETAPHQAIHLAVDTGVQEGGDPGVKAYTRYIHRRLDSLARCRLITPQLACRSSPEARKLCIRPCAVRAEVPWHRAQRSYVSHFILFFPSQLTCSSNPVDLLLKALNSPTHLASPVQDLEVLQQALASVVEMIDRVIAYVRSVLSGEVEGNEGVGRYLMDTLSETTDGLEKGKLEGLFNAHLQVGISHFTISELSLITHLAGYAHGFVSCQFGSVTSGGFLAACISDLIRRIPILPKYNSSTASSDWCSRIEYAWML